MSDSSSSSSTYSSSSESESDDGPRDESTPKTVAECLSSIFGTSTTADATAENAARFESCTSLTEEFAVVKKAYFRRVLRYHPDKGGDPATFRRIQTSFEVVRELYSSGRIASFADEVSSDRKASTAAEGFDEAYADFDSVPTPSWAYYAEAAGETVPTYRVELARSGRSKCAQRGAARKCTSDISEPSLIPQGDVRVGWLDDKSGSYGRWVHLPCWRVPSKVWLGLPDPESEESQGLTPTELYHRFEAALRGMNEVLLCGVGELPGDERRLLVEHCMDKSNWARLVRRKDDGGEGKGGGRKSKVPEKRVNARTGKLEVSDGGAMTKREATGTGTAKGRGTSKKEAGRSAAAAAIAASTTTTASVGTSAALVAAPPPPSKKEAFVVPRPGANGCPPDALAGKTVVLTGIFPELGGGTGLGLGKDRAKAMIQSFGGRVTSAISGKTDILLVGKDPGFSKVSKARGMAKVTLMSLRDVRGLMEGRVDAIEDAKKEPLVIESFSAGYSFARGGPNSLALGASRSALAIAAGTAPAQLDSEPAASSKAGGKTGTEAKKAKKAVAGAKKAKTVAKKKGGPKKRAAAAPAAKKKKSRKKAKAAPQEEVVEVITCDSCGTDCTAASWLVERSGEDFCEACYAGGGRGDGVPQANGVAVRVPLAIKS